MGYIFENKYHNDCGSLLCLYLTVSGMIYIPPMHVSFLHSVTSNSLILFDPEAWLNIVIIDLFFLHLI